ncbi:hypothetical protein 32HC_60 [Mycobacterium phage 32HC]|uniref:Uncharacterized protein n=1 Tax=Mycobacterium phage 32HC TaxID=1445729 RepID=W8EAF6_9CAUD|nr:hypothetical protein ST32HC_60 [Mycobacterium phage 32HC]AHJ86338.1 hypothetical protein 32HC_60 [Mycobacterium phage 32HC]
MIDVEISKERAEQLIAAGCRPVQPFGLNISEVVFMFTGPGLAMAKLAYTDALPADVIDVTAQEPWDIATLRIERSKTA